MLTQFSEILARQAQGWSVPGCVRQRGWTPSLPRISSQTDHRTSPVVPFRALLMASAEVLRGFTGQKLPAISSGIGSPCESFNKKKQFSGSDEFTRTTSIETCRCCEWLKNTENSWRISQRSSKLQLGLVWNWVFTNSSFFIFKFFIARSSRIPPAQSIPVVLVWHIPFFDRLDLGRFTSSYQLLRLTGG